MPPASTAPDPAELIRRAREIAPRLAERALDAERARKPHDDSIREIEDAGLLALLVPRARGGSEADLGTLREVVAALGEGCTSTAWVASFYMAHAWIASLFPEQAQDEFFAEHPWLRAPAAISPGGAAVPEDDGFRLKGRWPWGTGVMHANWVFVSGLVKGDGPAPDARFFALPAAEAKVEDTWFTSGMRATGSNDLIVEDAWVPAHRTLSLRDLAAGRTPGSRLYPAPLYRLPLPPMLALTAALPALGTARAALELFRERLRERVLYLTTTKQRDKPAAQIRLARAEVDVHAADLLLRDLAIRIVEETERHTPPPQLERARLRMSAARSVELCRHVVANLMEAAGSRAHFEDNPLQRMRRDLDTLASHVIFEMDGTAETVGRVLLGLDTDTPLV